MPCATFKCCVLLNIYFCILMKLCYVFVFQWFGDAEKLTKALFSLARKLSPAVIFVDEVTTEHTLLDCCTSYQMFDGCQASGFDQPVNMNLGSVILQELFPRLSIYFQARVYWVNNLTGNDDGRSIVYWGHVVAVLSMKPHARPEMNLWQLGMGYAQRIVKGFWFWLPQIGHLTLMMQWFEDYQEGILHYICWKLLVLMRLRFNREKIFANHPLLISSLPHITFTCVLLYPLVSCAST